ncbi:MAG: methyl-accepting chemotaxis protein, partial [Proteobacteria bacterium]|nr:methyl-accepting chemotaxis protein [Pseudomonadota bacterium]
MNIIKQFKNLLSLSTKKKMYAGFATLLGIMGIVVIVVLINLLQAQSQIKTLTNDLQPATITSLKLSKDLQKAITELGFYMLSKDEQRKESYLEQIRISEIYLTALSGNSQITTNPVSIKAITEIQKSVKKLIESQDKIFSVTESFEKNYPAASYSAKYINPLSQKLLSNIELAFNSEIDEYEDNPRIEILNSMQDLRYTWSRVMSEMRAFLGFRSKTNLLILDDQLEYFAVVLNRVNDGFSDKLTFEQEDSFLIIKESSLLFREHLSNVRDKHLSDEWRQDAWLIKTEIGDLVNMININLDVLVKETRNQSNEYAEGLSSNTGNTIVVVVTLLIIAIAAIVIMIWLLTTQIIKPMTTAVDNGIVRINDVMAIMSGDADNNIKLESSDDEIERVEKTLAIMTDTLAEIAEQQVTSTSQLKEKIQLINDVVSQAANGDLTGQLINFDGEEGIDQLASGIQSMIDSLNKLVSQVQQSGIQVTSSTTEIAATAKEQEATVTEQAAATNQIMATATQISATT